MTHLELHGSFDLPSLLRTHTEEPLKLLLSVRPDDALRALHGGTQVGADICLLFDVSQSMEEDQKLSIAIAAGRELIDLADPHDTISIVAFDDEPTALAVSVPVHERTTLLEALEGLRSVGGGMTNMTAGLSCAIDCLVRNTHDGQARAILLLSDGEDNYCKPDVIHQAIRAADHDIQLFAVGMGADYEADFLKALIAPSNGSLFGSTDVERIQEAFIHLAVTLANVVATQTSLTLTFSPYVLVGKSYKASPDQLFLGNTRLDPQTRTLRRRVGNVERNKEYAFLYELILLDPPKGPSIPIVDVAMTYDIPTLQLRDQSVRSSISIATTTNPAEAERRNGHVLECFRRVQVTELVERFVEAHRAGNAPATAQYLDVLIQKYNDVNDQKMVNHYNFIRRELLHKGQVTRAMINASVVASTVVRTRGELPMLIDDTF